MNCPLPERLTLAEIGALALAEAARGLDGAEDTATFLAALERNQEVWLVLAQIAATRVWHCPSERQVAFALSSGAPDDERVNTLIDINREVSGLLARGDDMAELRRRAAFAWEMSGRPRDLDLHGWLMAEMKTASG